MATLDVQTKTLIPPREALEILTFVSRAGLYAGSRGTDVLTKFPCPNGRNLYSKEECEALRDRLIGKGFAIKDKLEGADDYVSDLV